MEWITIILILGVAFLLFKNFKHTLFRKSLKIITIILLLFLVLAVSSSFIKVDSFLGDKGFVSKTGASIINIFKDNINEDDFVKKEELREVVEDNLKKAKNLDIARKIYK